ncbi:hypothetical protein NOK12_20230 [Nocardioides sp. OK12]|uniref:DUF5994 family protein n=1 Tax=Nocardioides sp. OK12 TaxID=2758661 RepID=UPI0021C2902E|nr:DUF5994 family protein [Nocardioides sp. OK12]GHJ59505.1 hypothetical protein NOK12_20230 [Nocardioides sp. OK12]
MTTATAPPTTSTAPGLEPTGLRLRLAAHQGHDHLDGGWWPHSRDLSAELRRLVDDFPPERGRVVRVLYSPPDWDNRPVRSLPVAAGQVKVGFFPHDDTHLVHLTMSDRSVWLLAVVPPGFSADQGEEALLAAATSGNQHSAADLLHTVEGEAASVPADHWARGS